MDDVINILSEILIENNLTRNNTMLDYCHCVDCGNSINMIIDDWCMDDDGFLCKKCCDHRRSKYVGNR